MGTMENPLVREYLQSHVAASVVREPEGYLLEADTQAVVVIGADEAGASTDFRPCAK